MNEDLRKIEDARVRTNAIEEMKILTVGEFRKGVAAIIEAIRGVSGSKFHYRIEMDQMVVSLGAETFEELEKMKQEEVEASKLRQAVTI